MKNFKRLSQKNVEINKNFYTDTDYLKLKKFKGVFECNIEYIDLRIDLEEVKELKIVNDTYGFLTTIAILKESNKEVYIIL